MSWKTPLVADGLLCMPLDPDCIAVGSLAWYRWLADELHCSFHFVHPAGDFTARKERKQRGTQYWVAYRQVHSKLYKVYLGKPEVVDEPLLCRTAQKLARVVGTSDAGGT
jgi:LuxR family transcriptional regulator, maltose regulon positive regulatory protein